MILRRYCFIAEDNTSRVDCKIEIRVLDCDDSAGPDFTPRKRREDSRGVEDPRREFLILMMA